MTKTSLKRLADFIQSATEEGSLLEAYTEMRFGRLWIEVYNLSNGEKLTVHESTWIDYKGSLAAIAIDIIC
jgi:hypothetical protein